MVGNRIHIIIVAAGSGRRFGQPLPKQFCPLNGRPLLMTTIERLYSAYSEAELTVVLHPDYESMWIDECRAHAFNIKARIVHGGATRWHSVKNALDSLDAAQDDIIMIHDGARPCVSQTILKRAAEAVMSGKDAVVPAIPVTDSLRHTTNGGGSEIVDRSRYLSVQTPQAFKASTILEAYRLGFNEAFTDDASVVEASGICTVSIVDGDPANIKVTHPIDIGIASLILSVQY